MENEKSTRETLPEGILIAGLPAYVSSETDRAYVCKRKLFRRD